MTAHLTVNAIQLQHAYPVEVRLMQWYVSIAITYNCILLNIVALQNKVGTTFLPIVLI